MQNETAVTGHLRPTSEAGSNHLQATRPSGSSAYRSGDGFAGIVRRSKWIRRFWSVHPRVYRPKGKLLRSLLQELRNCAYRIYYVCKHRVDIHGVRVGKAFQLDSDGRLQWDKQTLLCNQDIEHFLEIRSSLTLIDCELFREGWFAGYRSRDRNCHSQQSVRQS
jgi:hypothetical protein